MISKLIFFQCPFLIRITWIAYVAEFWVYPFLRVMPNSGRIAFFTVAGCILAFFYFLGKWKTRFIWGGKSDLFYLLLLNEVGNMVGKGTGGSWERM